MIPCFDRNPFLEGFRFAEGPRWRNGRLWFSDIDQGLVLSADKNGKVEVVAHMERPSGLGFALDGTLLAVSMAGRSISRLGTEGARLHADLAAFGTSLNDMVVLPDGSAYVDCYRMGPAFSPETGPDELPVINSADINRYYVNGLGTSPNIAGEIALVSPDGQARIVASDINYPNGLAVAPDHHTLVVSESHLGRLLAYDIETDGSLSNRRVWADLPGRHPDGLCFDAEGAVWVASVATSAFLRVHEGGKISHQIPTPGLWAVSCALGGEDGRTLYMITMEPAHLPEHRAWVETALVDVPGIGSP